MRRVAITGMGIVSSIGNNAREVSDALRAGKSGITLDETHVEHGFRSQISGRPTLETEDLIDKRVRRFMGAGAAWNYVAMQEAIADAGLEEKDISDPMSGIIMGSGGPSVEAIITGTDKARAGGVKRIGPVSVPKTMSSTNSATLATPFGIKGVNYSISSACATSAHCIGNAGEMIQWGKQDLMFAGGGEEVYWVLSAFFDAMGAMSSKYNDTPASASRAFDVARDGFVIAGGAGVLVLEEMERAKARGANIHAELVGYGATSDGFDMVQPSGEGFVRCMKGALKDVSKVDYINPHATSTPIGDTREVEALREVFGTGKTCPAFSATKSLTGHSLGGAGVQEAIYALLMMKDSFIAGSANIESLDPDFADMPIALETQDAKLDCVLSNSFGFGGTNATLVMKRL